MDKKSSNKLVGRFWITNKGKNVAGGGRVELLRRIKDTGSISAAAKEMAMSYKAAWDSVNSMNKLADAPLVQRSAGGKQGGGTALTNAGEEFISLYGKYSDTFDKILAFIEENPENSGMIGKTMMKTSADNIFCGKITKTDIGAVNAIIYVETDNGQQVAASMTIDSFKDMGIDIGVEVCALITASSLIVIETASEDEVITTSARNKFSGKVSVVTRGAVNSEIILDMPSKAKLKIIVSNESADGLSLSFGKSISAYCQAANVIIVA